jgi:hypothetical protein
LRRGRLGWRPEFRWQRLARWAERHDGVRVLERRAMPPLGHFSLIRFQRLAAGKKVDGRQHAPAEGYNAARDLRHLGVQR